MEYTSQTAYRSGGGVDDTEVASTAEALDAGQRLSEAAASGSRLGPSDQAAAESILSSPAVAQVGATSSSGCLTLQPLLSVC